MKQKQIIDGMEFNIDTPKEVVNFILNNQGKREKRFVFDFGDIKTGRSWNEEHYTAGYIGRSTGNVKIPLLIHNKRSLGGGALLDDCIIKISESKGKRVLYQHPNYNKEETQISL